MLKGVNPSFFEFSKPRLHLCDCSSNDVNYDSDEFRMYGFKIKRCSRTRSHDWTECPFAHRGEKARRRDPRKFNYSAIACPEFRTGDCLKGESCEFAHGVFEFWLHPSRYRTRACNAGKYCQRKVCFFAHTPEQLRPTETIHKCRFMYRARMGGSSRGAITVVGSDGGERVMQHLQAASISTRNDNENSSEENLDVLKSLRGLKIGDEDGDKEEKSFGWDVSDLPDIDWIWELVK